MKEGLKEAAELWAHNASDEHALWGILLQDKSNIDEIAFVNDVVELAFIAGAEWAMQKSNDSAAQAKESPCQD